MGKLTARTAISTNIDENLLVHVVDTTTTATSYKATLSQLYGIFPKNSSAGASDINYVTRWTAADELGKGIIRDNGTTVDFNGAGLSVDRLINGQFDTNGATDQFALYLLAETDASGAGGTAHGGHIQVNATAAGANDIRGLLVKAAASVDADVSTVDGLNVQSTANGTGSVGTIKGINVSYVGVGTDKTASNVYGIYVANLYDDGTITNNKYAIYQSGANDPNYFAGLSTFNRTLTVNASGVFESSADSKLLLKGSTTGNYIEYYDSVGARRAYLGFTGATEFRINNEAGGLLRLDGGEIRLGSYDFDGTVVPGAGQDGHVLTYNHSSGKIGLEAVSSPQTLQWVKVSVDYTDFPGGLGYDVAIYTLPAGYVLHGVKIKHSTAFGGGSISSYTLSVGLTNDYEKYASAFDVLQAVSDTTFQLSQVFDSQNHGSTTTIRANAKSIGATLDNATSGAADIWLLISNAAI